MGRKHPTGIIRNVRQKYNYEPLGNIHNISIQSSVDEKGHTVLEDGFISLVDPWSQFANGPSDPDELDRYQQLINQLDPFEADIIYLTFVVGFNQGIIASMFGVSQPTISYRLNRGIMRLRIFNQFDDHTSDDVRQHMKKMDFSSVTCPTPFRKGLKKEREDAIAVFWDTYSQTGAARSLGKGWSQGRVRHHIRIVMGKLDPKHWLSEGLRLRHLLKPTENVVSNARRTHLLTTDAL